MAKQQDSTTTDLAALVTEAEAAVKSVKDPELRRVAFEKILETLISQTSSNNTKTKTKSTKRSTKKKTKAAKGKSTSSSQGPKARVAELIDDGFFKKQRTIADVKAELANRGHHIAITSLSGPLQSHTKDRRLRRQKQAASGKGSKSTYVYSNW